MVVATRRLSFLLLACLLGCFAVEGGGGEWVICWDAVDEDEDGSPVFAPSFERRAVEGSQCPEGTISEFAVVDCNDIDPDRSPEFEENCQGTEDRDCDGVFGADDEDCI